MINRSSVILISAKSRRTAISKIVASITNDKIEQHKIKEKILMYEDMYSFYIGKGVVLLKCKDVTEDLKIIIGILEHPVKFDKKKKQFARIMACVLFNDNVYNKYIDFIARFYNIIGQDSLRKEILVISEKDNITDEEKEKKIKELLVREEEDFYDHSEVN